MIMPHLYDRQESPKVSRNRFGQSPALVNAKLERLVDKVKRSTEKCIIGGANYNRRPIMGMSDFGN